MGAHQLTAGRLRELLHYNQETGVFTRLTDNGRGCRVGDVAGTIHRRSGYVNIYLDGHSHTAARLAWLYMTGQHPVYDMDHINGDKMDNRWQNLRDIPTQLNSQNTHRANKNSTTGFMGVQLRKDRNKYTAQLRVDGRVRRFGSFNTPEEAHAAYLDAKRVHHPGFSG